MNELTPETISRDDICEIFGPMIANMLIEQRLQSKRIASLEKVLVSQDGAKPLEAANPEEAEA